MDGRINIRTTSKEYLTAAHNGDIANVRKYITETNNTAALNTIDDDGKTALMYAAEGGHIEVVNELLAVPRININISTVKLNGDRVSVLTRAVTFNRINVIQTLLACSRYDLKAEIECLLDLLSSYRDQRLVLSQEHLDRLEPYKLDFLEAIKQKPEQEALRILRDIVEKREIINLVRVCWHRHPSLHRGELGKLNAEYEKRIKAYQLKLDNLASPMIAEQFLDAAAECDKLTLQAYMNANANDVAALNVITEGHNENVLIVAIKSIYSDEVVVDVIKTLLTNKHINVNHIAGNGSSFDTALIWATDFNKPKTVKVLLEAGADVNCINRNQETALTYAASHGLENIVEMLLSADINLAAGNQYKIALGSAIKKNHHATVSALFAAPSILKDEENRNAAYVAIVVVLLINEDYPLTAEQLAALKQHKRGLFDAMMKMDDDKIVEILKGIFEEKDSALSKVIWSGHPSIHKGRLALFYAEYEKYVPKLERVKQPLEQSFFTKIASVFATAPADDLLSKFNEYGPIGEQLLLADDEDSQAAPKI